MNRREFIATSSVVLLPGSLVADDRIPWYRSMRRCGQTNFNERDPETLDIDTWITYWTNLKLDALLLSAGGITAFYPTKVAYHHRSDYLKSRDLFGDFTRTAKAKGMRVVARLDCNYAREDALKAHPEWFERDAKGEPVRHTESPWLFKTCMYTTYFSEQMPAIIKELNSLYDVDGFFTNGWPSTGRPPVCYCEACKNAGDPKSVEFRDRHLARVLAIWKQWDDTAKQKKWDSVYVGNLGGGIRAVTDLRKLAEVAGWFNADHQGRAGNTPIWDCAQQGRVAQCVMKGRTITNVTGAYANSRPLWRHTSKSPEEATMWMAQTTASGMTPWYHWLGGSPEDTRWKLTGAKFFQWNASQERHFFNRDSVANIAVVFSQRTNAFYNPPGGSDPTEFLQGLYRVLLEGRFCFDFVHEDDLSLEVLRKYALVILPNVALLSDKQCAQLREYAQTSTGSLLATFETGRYDERGRRRDKLGLGDVFDLEVAGEVQGPNGNSYYARVEAPHPILGRTRHTEILPGAEYRLPVKSPNQQPLSVVPPYPAFPPEMVYSTAKRSYEPAVVVSEVGYSRRVWFPGDLDRSFWRSDNGDIAQLLQESIRWAIHDKTPVTVAGRGIVELFAWHTSAGYAIHMLNYTNPNMLRGWFRETYPIGEQRVRLELPSNIQVKQVMALRSGVRLPHSLGQNSVEFAVPRVDDYEVAAIML